MKQSQESYAALDILLDQLAESPETFESQARELATAWNTQAIDLVLPPPSTIRKGVELHRSGAVLSIEEQLRAEIDSIIKLDRDDEARLARRIEFARYRLEDARELHGLTAEDVDGEVAYDPGTYRELESTANLPHAVVRRWIELHALRTELVERNLYLALINVERYAHLGVPRLDLIQEGSASLFRAVDGFDWKRGLLFRTYAVHWLNQAYRSYLYNHGKTVRVPVYLQKALKQVRASMARLGNPSATADEIAEDSGLAKNLVESTLAAARSTFSMDVPMKGEDAGTGFADLLTDESQSEIYSTEMEERSLEEGLGVALDRLSDRERYVVEMRYGVNKDRAHTLSEVAQELGVSLERVRQIQMRAEGKMKTPGLRKAIDPFL